MLRSIKYTLWRHTFIQILTSARWRREVVFALVSVAIRWGLTNACVLPVTSRIPTLACARYAHKMVTYCQQRFMKLFHFGVCCFYRMLTNAHLERPTVTEQTNTVWTLKEVSSVRRSRVLEASAVPRKSLKTTSKFFIFHYLLGPHHIVIMSTLKVVLSHLLYRYCFYIVFERLH